MPSGISASQFTRWHLDHHAALGSYDRRSEAPLPLAEDQRALAEGALLHAGALPDLLPRRGEGDRRVRAGAAPPHRAASAWSRSPSSSASSPRSRSSAAGAIAFKLYIVPVFFIFPIAFALNRLGQHYDIDPADPAKWSTLVKGSWFWDVDLPLLELPPRAPLLPRRPVLQPPAPAEAPAAVLRKARHDRDELRRAPLALAGAEPQAARELG